MHPRYDDPNDHFEWVREAKKILVKGKTSKGLESIKKFQLDSVIQSTARAKVYMYSLMTENDSIRRLVEQVLMHNP